MPSFLHEALLTLFRNSPTLAPDLAREHLGVAVPRFTSAAPSEGDLTEVVPSEQRADLVIDLRDSAQRVVGSFIIEAQLKVDPRKRRAWPRYVTSKWSRTHRPVVLVAVTPSARVAQWAARPIDLGHPGFVLRPVVLGPAQVPIAEDEQIARRPELGVLSLVAHGNEPAAARVVSELFKSLRGLDDEPARIYADLAITAAHNEGVRAAIEAVMQKMRWVYQSDLAKKYFGDPEKAAREKGLAEGLAEGRAEGRAEGLAKSLLTVLEARGISVPDKERSRILASREQVELESWLLRAATAESLDDVLG